MVTLYSKQAHAEALTVSYNLSKRTNEKSTVKRLRFGYEVKDEHGRIVARFIQRGSNKQWN